MWHRLLWRIGAHGSMGVREMAPVDEQQLQPVAKSMQASKTKIQSLQSVGPENP